MNTRNVIILAVILIVIIGIGLFGFCNQSLAPEIGNDVDVVEAEREKFVSDSDWEIYNPHTDVIKIDSPKVGELISSPITITGEARGSWYFEATFPLILVDWDGLIIAEGYATATDDWMTNEFVPFVGTLEFVKPQYTGEWSIRGALIIKNSNASGLPENDKAVEIPIRFK